MAKAVIDRNVLRSDADEKLREPISAHRGISRYVLLGEPGIGKSSIFESEAAAEDTVPVSAYDFAAGRRPSGRTVFIDALEEYRIGEAGVDRLRSLIEALASSGYPRWRIACRAISLPPTDARRLTVAFGAYLTLQLDLLDHPEQMAILAAIGEADPEAFMNRVGALGAEALLGNPATLLLLRTTIARSAVPLDTRQALFAEATRQMSHEINEDMPERSERPPPVLVESAAEAASLVLLLSARSDLWLHSSLPPHGSIVTRDDLLGGRIDTEALRAAVDTPMFKGDGAGFQPTHRVVAEFLAGRALARAVAPPDPRRPALPLYRALAFLNGDDDRPAPALTGVFAWFATALAGSRLTERAWEVIRRDPEAVLFQGDAAALPTGQRQLLLDAVGRNDPWFLRAARGSSAIGGLAGDDLAEPFRRILTDAGETANRRQMVLEALATGRRVSALAADVRAIVVTPGTDHYRRLSALDAYLHIDGDGAAVVRRLLDETAAEPFDTASELRVTLAARLARAEAITAEEIRDTLVRFAATGDRVMGYARALGDALSERPIPSLFDEPLRLPDERAVARSFEVRTLVDRVLAATIDRTPELEATGLLRWLANVGIDADDRVEVTIQAAIAGWVDAKAGRDGELLAALQAAIAAGSENLWRVDFDYQRLTGREVPSHLREVAVAAAEATGDAGAVQLAFHLVTPFERHPDLYWRLVAATRGRSGTAEWHEALTVSEVRSWRRKRAVDQRDAAARRTAVNEVDRAWLSERIAALRLGSLPYPLGYASDVYLGYRCDLAEGGEGPTRVCAWLGGDSDLIAGVREGWDRFLMSLATTPREEGRATAYRRYPTSDLMAVAWADWRIRDGLPLEPSLPLAFNILRHSYALNENGEEMRKAALARLYNEPGGAQALLAYWAGALRIRSDELPQSQYLDAGQPVVRDAVGRLLGERRKLPLRVLEELIGLAAQGLGPQELLRLAELGLARPQQPASRRLLALTAFLLAPERHRGLLSSDLAGAEGDALFERLWNGRFSQLVQLATDGVAPRSELIVSHLGPRHPPPSIPAAVDRVGEVVAVAVATLAQQPTAEAAEALARLAAHPDLAAWRDTVEQRRDQQLAAMREAQFTPPAPGDVARALAAGPPATAADLRAVVRHTLDELAADIRDGDTSPWRGFWNRPTRGTPSPRVENDCRDLVTDRLRDRLERYGIPLRRTTTETRSGADRRADMLVLGEGAAALPIEVKRHWNPELWSAIDDQLHPYTRSAGSNGHGIYMVLWFGSAPNRRVPPVPGGGPVPADAAALRVALVDRLEPADTDLIDVVVIDVSQPPAAPRRARRAGATGTKTAAVASGPGKAAG